MIGETGISRDRMPGSNHRIDMAEATVGELLAALEEHGRVVLGLEAAGGTVQLREHDGTYYCDTSIKLYTFDCRERLSEHLSGLGIPAADAGDRRPA